jgi:hypothetical protein
MTQIHIFRRPPQPHARIHGCQPIRLVATQRRSLPTHYPLHQRLDATRQIWKPARSAQANTALLNPTTAILTMTALPLDRGKNFQSNNYDWVGYDKTEQLEEVNSSLGLSRKMLYCIHLVTQIAKLPDNAKTHLGHNLLQSINSSVQKIGGTEEQVRKNIALRTAETYRLGAKLYLLCRLYECVNAN